MMRSLNDSTTNASQASNSVRSKFGVGIITVVLLTCLGMSAFQMYRANVKTERYDQMVAAQTAAPFAINASTDVSELDFASLELRRASLRGKWLADGTIFLDNKLRNRWAGYHVLTPFQLEGKQAVILVNRGWVVAPRLRSELPVVKTTDTTIELGGVLRHFERRVFELKNDGPAGRVWQHVREDEYRSRSGLDAGLAVLPLMLMQTSESDDGLAREWTAPEHPALHHIGYAVMWLLFSVMAAIYGWMLWTRK